MKGSKESRQNRSQVSASFHRRTEHGGKEEEWMDGSDASFSKSLAFGRNLTPASWWKDQKTELFPSFNSASFHIKTEPGGKEEGWMDGSDASWSDLSCSRQLITLPPASINSLRKCTWKYKIRSTYGNRFESPPSVWLYCLNTIIQQFQLLKSYILDFVATKADIITT